jgi:hypothetical protein
MFEHRLKSRTDRMLNYENILSLDLVSHTVLPRPEAREISALDQL